MTFEETRQYYEHLQTSGGIVPGLDTIRELLRRLGDPQERIPMIQIAGTNGKGSVSAMISAILRQAGYRVGTFNSPFVFFFGEQIRTGCAPVSKERFASAFSMVRAVCEEMEAEELPHPTAFEVETAAAFLCFCMENVDLAVVEAGMGGVLDATNVIRKPLLSVLTSVGMDHMGFLGNTFAQIAEQKAGIIKDYTPCVSVLQPEEAMEVIEKRCHEMGSVLKVADSGRAEEICEGPDGLRFVYEGLRIEMPLHGLYQVENAVCAVEAVRMLDFCYGAAGEGFDVTDEDLTAGLASVAWPGRLEKIGSRPDFYIDGAHNPAAAVQLRRSWEAICGGRDAAGTVYIMGVLADKAYERIAGIMVPHGARVYTVTPPSARALSAEALAETLSRTGCVAEACCSTAEAVEKAVKAAGENGRILAFGSLSYLAEAKEALRGSLMRTES